MDGIEVEQMQVLKARGILDLAGKVYETVCEPQKWPVVLRDIATVTGSDSAILTYRDNDQDRANIVHVSHGRADAIDMMRQYNEDGVDPHFEMFVRAKPLGVATFANEVIPERHELDQIYRACGFSVFLDRFDVYYVGGVILSNDAVRATAIGLQRSRARGPWNASEMKLLSGLAPHVQRALRIQKEFGRLRTQDEAVCSGLDRIAIGMILFDASLNIVYVNRAGNAILRDHPAIALRNNRIVASRMEDTQAIHAALVAATAIGHDRERPHRTALGLRHPSLSTPLPILVTPIQGNERFDDSEKDFHAAVLLADPAHSRSLVAESLQTAYGLTAAESRTAIAIVNGLTIEATAGSCGTSLNTTKTQLKSVYRKLGVTRQAELVKLLLTGPFAMLYKFSISPTVGISGD